MAKRLIEAATSAISEWEESDLEDFQYLDIQSGTLLSKKSLESILWDEFGAPATESVIEERLYDLMLLLFRVVRSSRPSPAAHNERRRHILEQLYGWEMAARLNWGPTTDNSEPHIHVDPELDNELTALARPQWLLAANKRLSKFEEAAMNGGTPDWGKWGRFYSAAAVDAARESVKHPQKGDSIGSIEDIPWDDGEPPF